MTIVVRAHGVPIRTRIALAALAVVAFGAGAVLLAIGLAVVAALAVSFVIVGLGVAVLRRVRKPAAAAPADLVRYAEMREVFPDDRVHPAALPKGRGGFPDVPQQR